MAHILISIERGEDSRHRLQEVDTKFLLKLLSDTSQGLTRFDPQCPGCFCFIEADNVFADQRMSAIINALSKEQDNVTIVCNKDDYEERINVERMIAATRKSKLLQQQLDKQIKINRNYLQELDALDDTDPNQYFEWQRIINLLYDGRTRVSELQQAIKEVYNAF